jgi:ABC-type transporter Mla subunit MlaD
MNNYGGKILSSLMFGGTLVSLGYYLANNKQLTRKISNKVESLNNLSKNARELMHGVENSLHSVSSVSPQLQGEIIGKVEKKLNKILDNSNEIQKELTDLVSETKNSLKQVQKNTEINSHFIDLVTKLTPALVALPVRKRSNTLLRGFTFGGSIIGMGYYIYSNKKLSSKITEKLKEILNSSKVQDKLIKVVQDTKSSLNDTVKNVETSIGKSFEEKGKHLAEIVNRLNAAFHAGSYAAKESLHNSESEIKDLSEKPLDLNENSNFEPESVIIVENVNDQENNINAIVTGKKGNEQPDNDKFDQI